MSKHSWLQLDVDLNSGDYLKSHATTISPMGGGRVLGKGHSEKEFALKPLSANYPLILLPFSSWLVLPPICSFYCRSVHDWSNPLTTSLPNRMASDRWDYWQWRNLLAQTDSKSQSEWFGLRTTIQPLWTHVSLKVSSKVMMSSDVHHICYWCKNSHWL